MENDNTETVSPEDVKAFMIESDGAPPPKPIFLDNWISSDDEAPPVKDYKLTSAQIAEIAFNAMQELSVKLHEPDSAGWYSIPLETQNYYTGIVNFFIQSASNPNGHESCQALHDLVLDAKLRDGWTHGEVYSEAEKKDPILLSYKGLPPHLKARNFLFRCVVVGLIAVWKGH